MDYKKKYLKYKKKYLNLSGGGSETSNETKSSTSKKKGLAIIFIPDLIDDFLHCIYMQESICKNIVRTCTNSYLVTLGEVRDYILEFHANIQNSSYYCEENKFKSILFKVYKGYYYSYFV